MWQPDTYWIAKYNRLLNDTRIGNIVTEILKRRKIPPTSILQLALVKRFGGELKDVAFEAPPTICLGYSNMKGVDL